MAMYTVADEMLNSPAACFAIGNKMKGTSQVSMCLSSGPPSAERILILDTVVATGDTVLSAAGCLHGRYPDAQIAVAACYAPPDAIERIATSGLVHHLTVAVRASRSEDGWLVPRINGDAGEKLYGTLELAHQ